MSSSFLFSNPDVGLRIFFVLLTTACSGLYSCTRFESDRSALRPARHAGRLTVDPVQTKCIATSTITSETEMPESLARTVCRGHGYGLCFMVQLYMLLYAHTGVAHREAAHHSLLR